MYLQRICLLIIAILLSAAGMSYAEPIATSRLLVSHSQIKAGEHFNIAAEITIKKGYHIGANSKDSLYPTTIKLDTPIELSLSSPRYPKPILKSLKIDPSHKLPLYEEKFIIFIDGQMKDNAKPGKLFISSELDYQACDDLQCFAPAKSKAQVSFEVVDTASSSILINSDIFKGSNEKQNETNSFEKSNIFLQLIGLYFAGLLLAFTPCVYPMIPVTVGYFSTQSGSKGKSRIKLALAYVLGIAITYSILGTTAAITGGVFGAVMQSKIVQVIISAVLITLALSMFDVYEIKPPSFIINKSAARAGIIGALIMGLIFGIAAAPCVGPAVLSLMAYVAKTGSPILGFLLFFSLSLGMGTPLFFLAAFSAKLPSAGMWMVAVKRVGGFVLLGTAAYFANPLLPKNISTYLIPVIILISGLYLGFIEKALLIGKSKLIFRILGSTLIIVSLSLIIQPKENSQSIKWMPYSQKLVQQAAADKKPVMIDFTADWCVACKELEDGVFSNPEVIRESKRFVRLRLDGTNTNKPVVKSAGKEYNIKGYPSVIFIKTNGSVDKSASFAGYVNNKDFLKRIHSIR